MTYHQELCPGAVPTQCYTLRHEFLGSSGSTPNSNFLKGFKWSPDGVCFLTAADDNWLRVYDLPKDVTSAANPAITTAVASETRDTLSADENFHDPLCPAVRVHAGELIYDYCWFSHASAADPATCCFAVTSRGHPVQLYDACTGELRCSYRVYNGLDEPDPAYSIAFGPDGSQLFAGGHAAIHIFDVSRPGRDYLTIKTFQRKQDGQPGIISSISFAPDNSGLMAVGSYSGVAALYDSRTQEQLFILEGHRGGITHTRFSADGNYLYTGARRDGLIYCWDARNATGVLYTLERDTSTTNQRIFFDIEPCGRHLATGGEDGWVRFFDLRVGEEVGKYCAAADVVNGCEFHPLLPLLGTASGQRRFAVPDDDSDSTEDSGPDEEHEHAGSLEGVRSGLGLDENVVRVWSLSSAPPVGMEENEKAKQEASSSRR